MKIQSARLLNSAISYLFSNRIDRNYEKRKIRILPYRLKAKTYLLSASLLLPSLIFSQSQNLPIDHWAYRFLDRLETRGLFVNQDFNIRPYSRETFTEFILDINEKISDNSSLLSTVEAQLFEQLKGEFYEELQNSNQQIAIDTKEYEPHLFSVKNNGLILHWDGLLGNQTKFESKQDVDIGITKSITYWGGSFRANINRSLAIFADARSFILSDTDSMTNTTFNPSEGLPVTRNALGEIATTDNASGYVVFKPPWLTLEVGRDLIEWGPGFRGNLVLSRNSNFYDLFKFTFRFDKFKFEHFHGFLNSDITKYLAGHRLEIRPFKNLQLALSETVVYGERSVEFLYFNPFIPIIIAERHLGDQDNNMVSFDFVWYVTKLNFKLYAEILVDDFSLSRSFFNSSGNKWGVLTGGYWVNPFGLPDTDLRFELVRIQPFLYSHRLSRNTYSNYDKTIGHWLGPDADDWYFELARQFHKNLRIGVSWEQRRRGENDIRQGTPPVDGRSHFLDGVVERIRAYGLIAQWQIHRDLFLDVNYNFIQSKNLRRVTGADQNNHRLFLKVALNY